MGQNNYSKHPELIHWKLIPNSTHIFRNEQSGEHAELHQVQLEIGEESALKKRSKEHHNFIAKVLYLEHLNNKTFNVYTERLQTISKDNWVPVTSALSILKGFRRLSSSYGYLRINLSMVWTTINKDIRVWLNEDPIKGFISQRATSEEEMLADIVKIIMQFEGATGSLMANCFTLNEAINNILHSITESKSSIHLSNRTSKNEENRNDKIMKEKSKFRSTNETQDEMKPFNDRQREEKNTYLQNVHIQRTPVFIDSQRQSPSKYKPFRKDTDEVNYSHNIQKQSSIQFNNSQPAKVSIVRPYKPIEHRIQSQTESSYNYQGYQNRPHESSKYKNVEKAIQFGYYPGRQSNLENNFISPNRFNNIQKNYIERIDQSQGSELGIESNRGSQNERAEMINTSREFAPNTHEFHYKNVGDLGMGGRTKTQEFHSSKNETVVVRLKTNYLNTPNAQTTSSMGTKKDQSFPRLNILNSDIEEVPTEIDKREEKLKQAQTIKNEMHFLGIESVEKPLFNDKSARDLLIRQRVEEKNKKHEELKFAMNKLLSN